MRIFILITLLLVNNMVFAREDTPAFKITYISSLDLGNMSFRVGGMPAMPATCPGSLWAYVDESDSTANAKISLLLAAFSAGKSITLAVSPVNYFNNGVNYCKINAVVVSQ